MKREVLKNSMLDQPCILVSKAKALVSKEMDSRRTQSQVEAVSVLKLHPRLLLSTEVIGELDSLAVQEAITMS